MVIGCGRYYHIDSVLQIGGVHCEEVMIVGGGNIEVEACGVATLLS